jgi:hypothetical protein
MADGRILAAGSTFCCPVLIKQCKFLSPLKLVQFNRNKHKKYVALEEGLKKFRTRSCNIKMAMTQHL